MTIEQCIISIQQVDKELEKRIEPLDSMNENDDVKIELLNNAMDSLWGAVIDLKKLKEKL